MSKPRSHCNATNDPKRRARREGRAPRKARKTNLYYLDEATASVVRVTKGVSVPPGARAIETLVGTPAPKTEAFYAVPGTLPEGASLTIDWSAHPDPADPRRVQLFATAANAAGVGRQSRATKLDRLRTCTDPDLALDVAVAHLEELLAPTPEDVEAAVLAGIEAASRSRRVFDRSQPTAREVPNPRLAAAFAKVAVAARHDGYLDVRINLSRDGGTYLSLRCLSAEDATQVEAALRAAGARWVKVAETELPRGGVRHDVKAVHRADPLDVACALAGTPAVLTHSLAEDGTVLNAYSVQLAGTEVTSLPQPTGGTRPATEFLVSAALERIATAGNAPLDDGHTALDRLATEYAHLHAMGALDDDPPADFPAALAAATGPCRSLAEITAAAAEIKDASSLLPAAIAARATKRPTTVATSAGETYALTYAPATKVRDSRDQRPRELPDRVVVDGITVNHPMSSIDLPDDIEGRPVFVRVVRFEEGDSAVRISRVDELPVADVHRRHEELLAKRVAESPEKAAITLATQAFTDALAARHAAAIATGAQADTSGLPTPGDDPAQLRSFLSGVLAANGHAAPAEVPAAPVVASEALWAGVGRDAPATHHDLPAPAPAPADGPTDEALAQQLTGLFGRPVRSSEVTRIVTRIGQVFEKVAPSAAARGVALASHPGLV